MQTVFEAEGCLLPRISATIEHHREGRDPIHILYGGSYTDPQRVHDQGLASLVGTRSRVQIDFFYHSGKTLFVAEGQEESAEVLAAQARGWSIIFVRTGDRLRITARGFDPVWLGVEPAQTELRLIDVATHAIVPLEEMRYGVSYKLELILGQRHATSDIYYEIAWGEGRNQKKDVLMTAVDEWQSGYIRFQSDRPIVFDDLPPLRAQPRRER